MGCYSDVIFPRLCDLVLGTWSVAARRQELLSHAYGNVLEIGFGTGLNLPHYPEGVGKITTVDPSVGMHRLAQRRVNEAGIEVDTRILSGERLPFQSDTFDCVVSTFTLCSIDHVEQALGEACRVLKPSGRFLFMEHGLAPEANVQKWQQRLNWLEMRLADGCRLNRNIKALIAGQAFSSLEVEEFYMEKTPRIVGYIYRGIATK